MSGNNPTMMSKYSQSVEALYARINFERLGNERYNHADFKLERMRRLLERLDNPHTKLPVVHVAGTKGKGTVCTLVAEMLQQAGYRVGLYTSPHQYRIEERFVVNGQLPTESQFSDVITQVLEVAGQLDCESDHLGPTFFECVNAAAWLHFLAEQVDIAVLEVGLGGRLDSTNLCQPVVTAITSISFDHMRILGNTLAEIAGEKAGIIKPNVPVVCGVIADEPRQRIEQQAELMGANLLQFGRDFEYHVRQPWTQSQRQQIVEVKTGNQTIECSIRQPGPVYAFNSCLAVACVQQLHEHGFVVDERAQQTAINQVNLPLRFEILRESPCLIADSAHNPASLAALVETLHAVFPNRRKTMLLAVSRDKDIDSMCAQLTGVDRIIATTYRGNERALDPSQLMQTLQERFAGVTQLIADPEAALQSALQAAQPQEIIVATGSLFFAAEIKQLVQSPTPNDCPQTV